MKIKIEQANAKKIEDALEAVNGRATSFTLTTYAEIAAIAENAEARLAALPVAKRAGVSIVYRPSGPSANAYRHNAKSTEVRLERNTAGWYVTEIRTAEVYPKSPAIRRLTVTRAQADEIARRAIADFRIAA
jgi:hypothetical protein